MQAADKIEQLRLEAIAPKYKELTGTDRLTASVEALMEAYRLLKVKNIELQAELRKSNLREKSLESEVQALRQQQEEALERVESLLDWIETRT